MAAGTQRSGGINVELARQVRRVRLVLPHSTTMTAPDATTHQDAGLASLRESVALPVIESERVQPGGPDVYRWRLVAGNGRTLGQSVGQFPDERAAVANFRAVAQAATSLTPAVVHAGSRRGWTWRIENADGQIVVRSSRIYERHGSCQRAGQRMVQSLSAAAIGAAPPQRMMRDPAETMRPS